MKMIRILALLIILSGFFFTGIPVYAAENSTESEEETVQSGGIDEMTVKMDENGKLTSSFDDQSDSTKTWNTVFKKYRTLIVGVSGVLTLTFILLFLLSFFRLGASSADNPTEHRRCLINLLWTGIAAAGSGSVTLICALFWNALK